MNWSYKGRSSNLEDRRGLNLGVTGTGLGLGGALVLLALSYVFHVDLLSMFSGSGSGANSDQAADSRPAPVSDAAEEPEVRFVSFVLDDAQQTWSRLLGSRYDDAKLVLFRQAVRSGCGTAPAAAGPFYCPADQKVYLDLSFFDELKQRFGAPGDFAQAYVLAHEIGHHVQNLLGLEHGMGSRRSNESSVRTELQADCLAGVWGHSTAQRHILERGDVEEGLNAASAIGDDRLQRMTQGEVRPDTFTHGTSAQRVNWFRRGLEQGTLAACDTSQGI